MPLSPGDRLGPYEILAPIGAGGMGEVYRAHDSRLNRDVAVKVSAAQFSERFEREAKAIAALNHPNICQIYDVGPNYLVMEYIEGESPKGPMPLDAALRIAHQIADALEAAHERGITHRDLKPANIKIKPDGTVKVLDFGLAKVTTTTAASGSTPQNSPTLTIGMTEAGMILGTASYMAPEQARGKDTDKRADIFAFGVVLHELITGKRLFGGEDVGEILARVIRDEPDLSDVPPSVHRLLSECLQKDPRKRLRDIGDVWRLLEEVPPPGTSPTPPPAAAPPSKTKWLWPALAALLLLSTSALSFVHFRETPPAVAAMRFEIFPPPKTTLNTFTISPDGRKLVFNARSSDGHSSLWLRTLDSLQVRELPGTQGANLDVAWSPNSESIAFLAEGTVKRIDIAGGAPQTLAPYGQPATGIAWSPQDVILFSGAGILTRVPASGGEAVPVTALNPQHGDQGHGRPFFLPDGKHFLYYQLAAKTDLTGVYVGSLDAKPAEQNEKAPPRQPGRCHLRRFPRQRPRLPAVPARRRPDGPALRSQPPAAHRSARANRGSSEYQSFDGLFSVSNNGVLGYAVTGGNNRQLTWYDRQGKVLGHVGEAAARDEMALSPDGTRVAEGRVDESRHLGGVAAGSRCAASTPASPSKRRCRQRHLVSRTAPRSCMRPAAASPPTSIIKPANGAGQGELLLHSDRYQDPARLVA